MPHAAAHAGETGPCWIRSESVPPGRYSRTSIGVPRQLSDALALPPADVYAVFHEKRATIAAVHDRPRLAAEVPGHPGIVLAGDYRYHAYPATLEAALRSGRDAVAALDRMLRHHAASASGH